jgi:hypothetical protein
MMKKEKVQMTDGVAEYYPDGINLYVPGAEYAADISLNSPLTVSLGTPAVADADGILDGIAITDAAGEYVLPTVWEADATFGRALSIVAQASDDAVVTLHGFDYLGQPMEQALTLNGTTGVNGTKAFKKLTKVSWAAGNGNASSTMDVGFIDVLGLPYKALRINGEAADGVDEGTLGTFVAPVLTDPQTATTGDPRGTYNPTTTLDGSTEIEVTYTTSNSVNAAGNGGLHGIAHFYDG